MGQNLVSSHLAPEQWAQLDQGLAQMQAALEPMLVAISASTKKAMVKMGDGSEAFCRKAVGVMGENIGLMPRDFDLAEVRRDLDAHDALNDRIIRLTQLLERMRDAEMALGSDVMVASLEGYAVLKAVGKGEGVEALKKMLGRRFDNGPRQEPAPPAPKPVPAAA